MSGTKDRQASGERGAAAVEYGLLAALVAVGIVLGAGVMGIRLNWIFNELSSVF
jgi:pilus assembly protein Flp/PilA